MREIVCGHPTHATREGQPGWNDVLGRRDDLPDGPPVSVDGLYCGPCGDLVNADRIAFASQEAQRKVDIMERAAAALGLTPEEAGDVFPELERQRAIARGEEA